MKYLVLLLLFSKLVVAIPVFEANYLMDTIPQPPGFPSSITGPSASCVGDTSVYNSDIPVSCNANWYINGVLQNVSMDILEVIWTENGVFTIILEFECDTSSYPSDSLTVFVNDTVHTPTPIQGDTSVCIMSTTTYTTEIGDAETCQWTVDGIVQISDSAVMSYFWSEAGPHIVEVQALNNCGTSNATYLDVVCFEMPTVDLGSDTTIFEGQSLTLYAGNPGCTYDWSTGEQTQSIVVSQTGNYEVEVGNTCGNVLDNIYVDVIVDIADIEYQKDLTVKISGDKLSFNIPNLTISSVQIWDMFGSLILISPSKQYYYFPYNGVFIVKVICENDIILTCKLKK